MNVYAQFVNFEAVINVKNQKEYEAFCDRCEKMGLSPIKNFRKISFLNLHMSAGMLKIPIGECCIEYQPYQGFTMGNIKSYRNYGLRIASVDEFLEATK